ncbi:MAG: DUF4065 domain-containing protein [Alphaproteobacteria bacterium]|jgi:uncharacterized phage-associated protein|nr:DUF4065 domain-containing protein [Alphaproteobacteria bacterium]
MASFNITVNHVANAFIKKFKEENLDLTHMQLQKLVYYAYAMFLFVDNKPLFKGKNSSEGDSPFEAWAYGPVSRELYNDIKSCNNNSYKVQKELKTNEKLTKESEERLNSIVKNVCRIFQGWSAMKLSDLSHSIYGAWYKVKESDGKGDLFFLQNEDIRKEVKSLFVD